MRQIKIGRNQDNDLVFPSSVVSGYHADITIQDNGLVVYTDHSTNGTVINGLKLHGNSVMVKPSDSIVLPDGSNIDLASLINHGGTVHVSHSGTVPVSPQFSAPYFQEQKQDVQDITFFSALVMFFQKYTDFSGRSRRKEYWLVYLWNVIIGLALGICFLYDIGFNECLVISSIWSLITLIPGLALASRRLHDTGRPAEVLLLALLPLIGSIILLVYFCLDSQPESNKWGPCPK